MRKRILLGILLAGLVGVAVWTTRTSNPNEQGPDGATQSRVAPSQLPVPPRPSSRSGTSPPAPVQPAWSPSSDSTIERRYLEEVVENPDDCRQVCGAACINDDNGRSYCGRRCAGDDDCGADSLCYPTTTGVARCTPSQCSGVGRDEDCDPGWTCLAVYRVSGATHICAKAGVRKAGESCSGIGHKNSPVDGLCGRGLACKEGVCLPAKCQANADCPNGSRCMDVPGGLTHPQCVPGCERDIDCGEKLKCVEYPAGRRVCANTTHATCLVSGCAEGSICTVTLPVLAQLHAECTKSCSPERPSDCASNEVCRPALYGEKAQNTCVLTCTPGEQACPPGKTCVNTGSGPATCLVALDAGGPAGAQ